MTLFQSTGAKGGRGLGTQTVTKGVPGLSDPRSMYPPKASHPGPCGATSGLSQLRGHGQGPLRSWRVPPLGTCPFQSFPLTQGASVPSGKPRPSP